MTRGDANPDARIPDFRESLAAFNDERRRLLGDKPIDPEGEEALMSDAELAMRYPR